MFSCFQVNKVHLETRLGSEHHYKVPQPLTDLEEKDLQRPTNCLSADERFIFVTPSRLVVSCIKLLDAYIKEREKKGEKGAKWPRETFPLKYNHINNSFRMK